MNLRDPRTQLSWLLILIFSSAVFYYKDILLFRNLLIATASTVFFDILFWKIRKIELFPPAAAITTGVIISLLISPTLPLHELIIASFFAIFSKNFIKGANRHIFNPAGFGVLASSIIFQNQVSWWGASFQPLNSVFFLILISPLLISVLRLKRFMIIIPFLAVYTFLIYIFNKTQLANTLTDPTVLFFSLVMLPEPQTTPNKKSVQILFGISIAVLTFFVSKLLNFADPLIFALLAGNLIFYRLK